MDDRTAHRDELLQRAVAAAEAAYAPYSKFRVGAAVLGSRGIYIGVNVENASFGLTLCAERVALSQAIAQGDRKIVAIAVACIDADLARAIEERMPCGACRQWMLELAPDAVIHILGADQDFSARDLLPIPFSLRD